MRPAGLLIGVVLSAGCHLPAAKPVGTSPIDTGVAGLVGEDTAATVVRQPGRSAAAAVLATTTRAKAWSESVFEKRFALRFLPAPGPIPPDRPILDPDEMEEFSAWVTSEPALPTDLRFHTDPTVSVAAVEAMIASANCRLDVMMYLWAPDEIGWRVARALAVRAAAGVPVRVLVDGAGNMIHGEPKDGTTAEKNAAVLWLAEQPNVSVLRTRVPGVVLDHRKLVVADGRVAYSGGRNFRIESFTRDHDLTFTAAGPLAARLADVFEAFWVSQGGPPGPPIPPPSPAAEPNADARLVQSGPLDRTLTRHVYHAVELARRHVYLHNPYFGDGHLQYLLAEARQRGVDVRVVLTLDSKNAVYDGANRVLTNRLLKAGCRVYGYPGMTHVKALAVDGVWAYTGTGNFDALSLRQNRELGVVFGPGPAVAALEAEVFVVDFRPEWELTRPLHLTPADHFFDVVATAVG